jgi:hypothetical protein
MKHPGTDQRAFQDVIEFAKKTGMVALPLYKEQPDRWRVAAYTENIEDEPVVQSTFPNPLATQLLATTLRPPRVYGVRMGVKF